MPRPMPPRGSASRAKRTGPNPMTFSWRARRWPRSVPRPFRTCRSFPQGAISWVPRSSSSTGPGARATLGAALDPVRAEFEFLFVDCPPALSLLTVNALTAADSVLVPIQTEYFALEGLSELLETIERVKLSFNPQLAIEGIV